jgi:hypothetical protein
MFLVVSLAACSVDTSAISPGIDGGGVDGGGEGGLPDVAVDGPPPDSGSPGDSGPPADTGGPPSDGGPVDSSTPMDTSVPMDTGPPPGTELWSRRPPYDESDFNHSMNMHFEGDEIHVPSRCRDLEMVTIADPASADWRNYEVSVSRLRFDANDCGSDSAFILALRTQSREATCAGAEGYACALDFDRDQLIAGRRDSSCGWVGGQRVDMASGAIYLAIQYDFSAEVIGNTITCRFDPGDGERTVSYTDSASTHATGGVAFIFDDVDARFGDPTVTAR